MIRKKETEHSTGPMAGNTKAVGKTENNTAWALTPQPPANQNKESGKMERGSTGSKTMAPCNDINDYSLNP